MMDAGLFIALLAPPLAATAIALAAPRAARTCAWFNAATMPVAASAAGWAAGALSSGHAPFVAGQTWRMDSLSALMAALVGLVSTLAIWSGPGFQATEAVAVAQARTFRIFTNLFVATMLVAVSTNNLGVMWVAIEATTISSALLIPLRRTRASVDASWKYLLIGSVGIALALTGTVLAFVDFSSTGVTPSLALNWTSLLAAAPMLHREVARLAFVFLLVGFGTKAGLAPMHTWLPEAHAEAPAPLSAIMSGVLLAVALYAIARWKAIVDQAAGPAFTDSLLIVVAVATVAVGSLSLLAERDYKRMFAFSSIEHLGLACFGLALGAPGVFAALLHLTGHAFAKSVAFLLSGRVLGRYGTREIAATSGLLESMPATGALLAASAMALAGLPPFGLFLSEILLVRAGWLAGHHLLTGAVLLLIVAAFAALVHHMQRMVLGTPPAGMAVGERPSWLVGLLVVPLVALVWIGVALPSHLQVLIERAAEVLQP